jgi:sialate O-acetylesterase
MKIMRLKVIFALFIFLPLATSIFGQGASNLKVADIFSDGMMIQKDCDIPVWGEESPGKKVKVSMAGQDLEVKSDKDGKWKVTFAPISEYGPFQLDIQGESSRLNIKDIACGDVWIFAGESIIGRNLDKDFSDADSSRKPQIRYFRASAQFARSPCSKLRGSWKKCEAGSNDMPAVAYYFADALRSRTNGPVGIVLCSVSDSLSHAWGSKDFLRGNKQLVIDDFQELIQSYEMKISGNYKGLHEVISSDESLRYAGAVKRFQMWIGTSEGKKTIKSDAEAEKWKERIQEWVENSMQMEAEGSPVLEDQKTWPKMIQIATGVIADPRTSVARPSGLFNGMISPLVPFAIKGFVFWQGEPDASWNRGESYYQILAALVRNWRGTWNKAQSRKGDLPFVIMQMQGVNDGKGISAEECSLLRLSQSAVQEKLNGTALAMSYDIISDSSADIPQESLKEAGCRLALCAYGKFYGQGLPCSGPMFDSVAVGESNLRLKFKYADSGLLAGKDGAAVKVAGFEIGDASGVYKPAEAEIDRNFIVLKTPGVVTNVRYGWGLKPDANLYNKDGLPALPFTVSLADK